MIRPFEPANEDDLIAVWLASTIPGQSFLPEEHWRAMEPEIRELVPIAEIWGRRNPPTERRQGAPVRLNTR